MALPALAHFQWDNLLIWRRYQTVERRIKKVAELVYTEMGKACRLCCWRRLHIAPFKWNGRDAMYAPFFLCANFHVQMDKDYSLKFLVIFLILRQMQGRKEGRRKGSSPHSQGPKEFSNHLFHERSMPTVSAKAAGSRYMWSSWARGGRWQTFIIQSRLILGFILQLRVRLVLMYEWVEWGNPPAITRVWSSHHQPICSLKIQYNKYFSVSNFFHFYITSYNSFRANQKNPLRPSIKFSCLLSLNPTASWLKRPHADIST